MSADGLLSVHALHIPEILQNVLEYSSNKLSCALVCKAWSCVALPGIWRNVSFDNILSLFPSRKIVAQADGSQIEAFTRNIKEAHWDRFREYSRLVRSLEVPLRDPSSAHPAFLLEIACSRPLVTLFPNLQSLDIQNDAVLLHLFAHKEVKQLNLRFLCSPTAPLFNLICTKMPRLKGLKCISRMGLSPPPQGVLEATLRKLPLLRLLHLPPSWFSTGVVSTLLDCLQLQVIDFEMPHNSSLVETFPIVCRPESFQFLRCLRMRAPFHRAARCFSQPHRPPKIDCLRIASLTASTSGLRDLFTAISCNYPQIELLSILTLKSEDAPDDNIDDWFIIMKQMRNLTNLRSLGLTHDVVLNLNLSDIISLSQALPYVEIIRLLPASEATPRLDVSALLVFIPLFPALRQLRVYLDVSASDFPCVEPSTRFQKLELLNIGENQSSKINNPEGLAKFLDTILPDTCQLSRALLIMPGWSDVDRIIQSRRSARRDGVQVLHNYDHVSRVHG